MGEEVTFEWFMDEEKQEEITALTNVQGRASIVLSSDVAGQAKIRAKGSGATDSKARGGGALERSPTHRPWRRHAPIALTNSSSMRSPAKNSCGTEGN